MIGTWAHVRLAVVAISLACCGPKYDVSNPSAFEEDDPRALSSESGSNQPSSTVTPKAPRVFPTTLDRSDYDQVLEAGPGRYNASIDVSAVTDERSGVLRGWEIVRWPYTWIDLRPGDVVLDINGTVIVRPNDLIALWASLKGASSLEVRIERNGEELTHRLDVE